MLFFGSFVFLFAFVKISAHCPTQRNGVVEVFAHRVQRATSVMSPGGTFEANDSAAQQQGIAEHAGK